MSQDTKIIVEKIETPKKSIETPSITNGIIHTKKPNEQILNYNATPFAELLSNQKPIVTPETPSVTPSTPTPSTPTSLDEEMFKVKPTQALCKSNDVNISLETYAGKYLFLIFYPQNLAKKNEVISLSKATSKFESHNVSLVGCSNDNKFSHANLNRTLGKDCINFPLIGDDKNKMSSLFSIGLDNTGKNKPTTLLFSPKGELIKRIDSMDVNNLLAEAEKLPSTS